MWAQELDLKKPSWPMMWKPHDEEDGAVMKNLSFGDLKKHSCHMGRRENQCLIVYITIIFSFLLLVIKSNLE